MRSPKLMVSVIVLGTAALIGYLTLTPSVSSSGATIAHAATSDSTVVTRRLLGGEASLDIATPSADGAFASSLDWDTGDLTVTDLRDGSVRRLHVQTSSGPSYTSYVESSRISPDGRRVAFAWIDERGTYSIRLASVDGSTPPRELYRDPKYWYLEVDGFAPDNRHVLLELDRHDGMFDYGMLDVDGGTLRPLVTGVPWVMGWVAFSPDSRYLLYTPRMEGQTYERRTPTIIDLSSGQTWPLVQWPTGAEHFAFTPDGKGVVLLSERGGTPGLWLQPVRDARAAGEPRLLKSDVWNASGIGITRDGRALYLVRTGERRVYSARLDPVSGTLTSSPTRVTDDYANYMTSVAVSPDGEWLSYNVSPGPWVFQGSPILTLRALSTGETRQLRTQLNRVERQLWSPDGKRLLIRGESIAGRFGVFVVDVATGEAIVVRLDDSANPSAPFTSGIGWSRDGRPLLQIDEPDSAQALGAADVATATITTVARRPAARRFVTRSTRVASDGETVAGLVATDHAGEHALVVGDFAGTRSRELMRVRLPDVIFGFAWSPDARWLYVQRGSIAAKPAEARIDRVRVADGVVQPTGIRIDGRFGPLVIHPDGARVFFVSGEYGVELWAMEHFMTPTP
jgi:Tol biopolymer transport system component